MKRIALVALATACLLGSGVAHAGFSIDNGDVFNLGTFTIDAGTVNAFDSDGDLITSTNGLVAADNNHATTLAGGTYRIALVSAKPNTSTVTSSTKILGMVGSNNWQTQSALTNVWSEFLAANGLKQNIFGDTLEDKIVASISSQQGGGATLTASEILGGLKGDSGRGIEITAGDSAPWNPDIAILGNQLFYDVGAGYDVNGGFEYSLVIAAPEPTSMAVWGICSVGGVVAARRRKRKIA